MPFGQTAALASALQKYSLHDMSQKVSFQVKGTMGIVYKWALGYSYFSSIESGSSSPHYRNTFLSQTSHECPSPIPISSRVDNSAYLN